MDNKDKQALINGTATIPYKIYVLNDDGNIKDTLTEEDIVSTDYEDYRYVDSSSLCIGQFVARKLKGEVKVIDKDLQIEDNEISVEMGVNRNDGSKEYALSIEGKSEQDGTPTPEAPVEIKTVKGIRNLFDLETFYQYSGTHNISNKTLTENGIKIDFTAGADAWLGDTKKSGDTITESIKNILIEVKGNTTYTLSASSFPKCFIAYCNENYEAINSNYIQIPSYYSKASYQFTTPENAKYVYFRFGIKDSNYTSWTFSNIQLEEGTIAHDYVPYGSWLQVKNTGKNLFDKDNAINGLYYDALGGLSPSVNWYYENIRVKPNTSYSISGNTTNNTSAFFVELNKNLELVKKIGNYYNTHNFTTSNETYYVGVSIPWYGDSDGRNNINTFQVEKGTKPTEYEPYKETSTLIDMNKYDSEGNITGYYELSSIGDTKDILTIQNEQAYINQKIGKVVLDGSESGWAFKESNTNTLRATCDGLTGIKGYSLVMSPELPGYRNNSAIGAIDSIGIAPRDNGLGFTLRLPVNVATDVNTLKTYLSSNPVTVYYILAEPQTIELPRINKIESIDNTENISIVTNIPTTFQITEFPLVNWYNLGNFLITKPTDDDVKDTLTFDSMDYTKKFNQTFDSTNIIFPCTALELAKYCCEQCGVELATTDFINNDFEVIDNQYTEEDTYRKVMQDIGKLAYSWVRIGWDNKCYIDFTYDTEVDEYNKITNDNYYDLEVQQKVFGPVNRVIIGMSDIEGENVYIEDEESISKYGATEIQIYDNNLTYTPELRNQAITNAKCLFGLTYTPMTLNTTGHPWLLGNEKCEVTYMDGTKQYTYPWDRTISYSGHIKTKLESKCDTKTETEYKYKGDVETLLNKTRIIVNKQEGTITSLTQTTETIQNNLQQNYYDITQTNQLIQTSSTGITNTFSEAGGNNIFRNTGLWFEDSSTSYYIYPKSDLYPSNKTFTNGQRAYEFWDGLVLKEYYDKAANLTSLLLQNGYFEQKQQVPNGNYTVSFKYKKLIESATTKVIINNVEYNLTKLQDTEFRTGEQDSDGNYITQPLEVTDGYIFVRFYTNINNSTIIYDLMVNAGSVKLAYSQNQNETTTDTVNISKGITITSSNTDTTFKANSDGIRTLNKNNEVLSEFTDKGMKNKQIEVTDEATIVQVLIQNIGDQTWFTRL